MTHTPPIPQGNQSPYPIAEPPHVHTEAALPAVARDEDDVPLTDRLSDLPLAAIGAAVGLGVALIGGVLLGLRRDKPKRRGRGRTR